MKILDLILQFFDNFPVLYLPFDKPLLNDADFILKLLALIFLTDELLS